MEDAKAERITKVNAIQSFAVSLSTTSPALVLEYATGVGKTLAALKIIAKHIGAVDREFHIVCWETNHLANWEKDMTKHGYDWMLRHPKVKMYCYASMRTQKYPKKVNFILDEGHHVFGETFFELFLANVHAFVLLSATLEGTKKAVLKKFFPHVTIDKKSLKWCIDQGILPKPNIYYVPMIFDNSDYSEVIVKTRGPKVKWEKLTQVQVKYGQHYQLLKGKEPVNMAILCTPAQKYEYLNQQVSWEQQLYFKNQQDFQKIRWMRAGGARKKFIGESKTGMARNILRDIDKFKTIVFCVSIDQAKALDKDRCIHSKLGKKTIAARLDKFNAEDGEKLYVKQMANEGMNLDGIEAGLIIQLDGKTLPAVQKNGRVLRAEIPYIFVIVAPGTKDEDYYGKMIEAVGQEHIMPYSDFTKLAV